jgi:predicted RNA-binding Zn ribbon-like protein
MVTPKKPYEETFRCPGGALCLDFCNSGQGIRGSSKQEWIAGYGELIDWLKAGQAIGAAQAARLRAAEERAPEKAREIWTRAIELREALARVLLARTEGKKPQPADLKVIDAEYARSAPFARLAPTDEGFAWSLDPSAEAPDAALRPIVESAVALLTSERLARLRRCGNSTCYWLFVDETRNCSRRWCEMASCGNVMKVRRHRARQRAA